MNEWIIFALIGVLSGLSSGLLGLGGGVIIVPALLMIFSWQGLAGASVMHMVVATSLMTIIVTSGVSTYSHHQHGHVNWRLVRKLSLGLVLGGLLGAVLAARLSSQFLQQFFAFYLLFAAIKMWFPTPSAVHQQLLRKSVLFSFGSCVGLISSLVGVGGGTLIVPYLVMANQSTQRAIGSSSACGFPISVAATIGFIVFGQDEFSATTIKQTDIIHWQAFFGIISTSIIFSIIGAILAKRLPMQVLKVGFSVILIMVSIYMFKRY